MTMFEPFIITPRLMCGLRVGDGFISITFARCPGNNGRLRFRYHIDVGDQSHSAEDLQSGCNGVGGSLQQGMASLLSFLGAAADAYRHGDYEELDMFPVWVNEWAYQHSDELAMLQCEIEESEKQLIEE